VRSARTTLRSCYKYVVCLSLVNVTVKLVTTDGFQASGNLPLELVIREIDFLQLRLWQVRDPPLKLVVVELQLEELRHVGERRRDGPGEPVLGEDHLLERPHPGERVGRDRTGELVPGQEHGPEPAELLELRHRAGELVVHEAQRAEAAQGLERAQVQLAGEPHLLELQAVHADVLVAHDAGPLGRVAVAWAGAGGPAAERAGVVLDAGLELEERVCLRREGGQDPRGVSDQKEAAGGQQDEEEEEAREVWRSGHVLAGEPARRRQSLTTAGDVAGARSAPCCCRRAR
jgi:hypothetical protein